MIPGFPRAQTRPGNAARLLVSACLLGEAVRYDGNSKSLQVEALERLRAAGRVVAFCPEVAGGLPVPRPPAEIQGGDGADVIDGIARVRTEAGEDVTDYFLAGARQALALCREHAIGIAVLTERSPSCGSGEIYDGSFSRRTRADSGVTTAWLRRHGIEVFNQHQLEAALRRLDRASQGRE